MLHLRDAMLDELGNAYAVGHIDYPESPDGVFKAVSAPLVKLGLDSSGRLDLSPSTSQPDSRSNYFQLVEEGPYINVNREIGRQLVEILHLANYKTPTTFSYDASGFLTNKRGDGAVRQGLSDWRGSARITEEDAVSVELSAAIRSRPKADWERPDSDSWPADNSDPPRISISFQVDAMTRVVRFGGWSNQLTLLPLSSPSSAVTSSLASMDLATAPFGGTGRIYGVTEDGRWVSFYESLIHPFRMLAIDAPGPDVRYACGLMTYTNRWPRVRFVGVDLDVVASAMWSKRTFGIFLTDGEIGSVQYSGGGSGGPGESRPLIGAQLNFELTVKGLEFIYGVQPEGGASLSGKVTIPWEVLSVRSASFLKHRKALLQEI